VVKDKNGIGRPLKKAQGSIASQAKASKNTKSLLQISLHRFTKSLLISISPHLLQMEEPEQQATKRKTNEPHQPAYRIRKIDDNEREKEDERPKNMPATVPAIATLPASSPASTQTQITLPNVSTPPPANINPSINALITISHEIDAKKKESKEVQKQFTHHNPLEFLQVLQSRTTSTPSNNEDETEKFVLIYNEVDYTFKELLNRGLCEEVDQDNSFTSPGERIAVLSHDTCQQAETTQENIRIASGLEHAAYSKILKLKVKEITPNSNFLVYAFAPDANSSDITKQIPESILVRTIKKKPKGVITISVWRKEDLEALLALKRIRIQGQPVNFYRSLLSEEGYRVWVGKFSTNAKSHHIANGLKAFDLPTPQKISILRNEHFISKGCAYIYYSTAKEMFSVLGKKFAMEGEQHWIQAKVPKIKKEKENDESNK
jgi:hypothetical protein